MLRLHCGVPKLGLKGGVGERDVVRANHKGGNSLCHHSLWGCVECWGGSHGPCPLEYVSMIDLPPLVGDEINYQERMSSRRTL